MWPGVARCLALVTNVFRGKLSANVTSSRMGDHPNFSNKPSPTVKTLLNNLQANDH